MSQKNALHFTGIFLTILFCALFFTGEKKTSYGESASLHRHAPAVRVPSADGTVTFESDLVSVDASHTDEGYVMVRYTGDNAKVKLLLQMPGKQIYTYLLSQNQAYETFPFSSGDGVYLLRIYENVENNTYALIYTQTLVVTLRDEFLPFLYPNQYVSFTPDSMTAAVSQNVSANARTKAEIVSSLYRYVCKNISYDTEKAGRVTYGYLPDVDDVLRSGKGICFDYAAVLTAMLRSQGIPAKLEVGYADEIFHAWVSVYLEDAGQPDDTVAFQEHSWNLLDPTLTAHGGSAGPNNPGPFTGDGLHYTVKYSY